jgi:hypothetical protein
MTVMQHRRGTAAAWTSANPILAAGEWGIEIGTNKQKVGDGTTAWNTLAYANTTTQASTTAPGIVELATTAETTTGTDTTRAVTPAGDKAALDARLVAASTTVAGLVELATSAEGTTGTDAVRAMTPQATAAAIAALAPGGGGGGIPWASGWVAAVYKTATNTVAINEYGAVISNLATSAANNVTVIQAAIDYAAGTYEPGTLTTLGYGEGGGVFLAGGLYETSATIILKYGVSLMGVGSMDRQGFVASAHSYNGTVIAPTSGLGTMDIDTTAGVATRTPVILCGYSTGGGGSQSQTNPHGVRIKGIAIDMRRKTTAQGIMIADTQFVTVHECTIGEARGVGGKAVEILSTNPPDDGAHANNIHDNLFVNCEIGVQADGSGSTDSLLSNNRILQMTTYTVRIGHSGGGGGWQVWGNHFTCSSGDQTGTTEAHLFISGAPTTVFGNYFDTTGGFAIYIESPMAAITGNYIKMSSTRVAPIYMAGTGRKSVVSGNTCQLAASGKALVAFAAITTEDFRPVIANNIIGDGGVATPVGAACTAGGVAVAETNAAMTVARDGTINPYIWGNRIVASAV